MLNWHVLKRDWITCSKVVKYSKLNSYQIQGIGGGKGTTQLYLKSHSKNIMAPTFFNFENSKQEYYKWVYSIHCCLDSHSQIQENPNFEIESQNHGKQQKVIILDTFTLLQ